MKADDVNEKKDVEGNFVKKDDSDDDDDWDSYINQLKMNKQNEKFNIEEMKKEEIDRALKLTKEIGNFFSYLKTRKVEKLMFIIN